MNQNQASHEHVRPIVTEGGELPLSHVSAFAQPAGESSADEEMPTICGDVLDAAHAQSQRLCNSGRDASRDGLLRVEAMLGVISYCYVKGVFDSGEIERRLWLAPIFLKHLWEPIAGGGKDSRLPPATSRRNSSHDRADLTRFRQRPVQSQPRLQVPGRAMAGPPPFTRKPNISWTRRTSWTS